MQALAQYYTDNKVSELLISNFSNKSPKKVLELGFGSGALLKVALSKWKNTHLIGCDLDKLHVNDLIQKFPKLNLYLQNGLSDSLHEKLNIKVGSIDIAICNPPYLKIKKSKFYEELLKLAGLGNVADYNYLTSDLIFLAQNIVLLRNRGELGIILPDGLFTSNYFKAFRKELFNNHHVKSIIQLPRGTFKNTDALTHILILKKGIKETPYFVKVSHANEKGELIDTKFLFNYQLIDRSDYTYHSTAPLIDGHRKITLQDLCVMIRRGKYSKKDLSESGIDFLHIQDIKARETICLSNSEMQNPLVEKGDLVMIRVGRSGIGKISEIVDGKGTISDCLFVIKVPDRHRSHVLESLRSKFAEQWFRSKIKGVAAKVLSKGDLLQFPLSNPIK